MSLFKAKYLKELRSKMRKEYPNVSEEEFEKGFKKVTEDVENDLRETLKKELPKAFWFPLYEMAEKGEIILEIDDIDIGKTTKIFRFIIKKS